MVTTIRIATKPIQRLNLIYNYVNRNIKLIHYKSDIKLTLKKQNGTGLKQHVITTWQYFFFIKKMEIYTHFQLTLCKYLCTYCTYSDRVCLLLSVVFQNRLSYDLHCIVYSSFSISIHNHKHNISFKTFEGFRNRYLNCLNY